MGLAPPIRWAVNLSLFMAAFASVGAGLSEVRPWERHGGLATRVRYLHEAEHPYDTLFFGSSRLHCGLDPAVFDRRMAELGHPTHSFSLALSGMRPHEVDVVLRKLLDEPPPGLQRIVIELARWIPSIAEENRLKPRTCAWHTPGQLMSIFRSEVRWARSEEQWASPALLDHLAHFVAYWTSLGEGPDAWSEWWSPPILMDRRKRELAQQRGFAPLSADANAELAARRRQFEMDRDELYPRLLERKRSGRVDARDGDIINPEALLAQCSVVIAHGIELVYIVPPSILGLVVPDWMVEGAGAIPYLRFDVPDDYPELFEPEVLFDAGHLNQRGAELWSVALADRYADSL